MTEFHFSLPRNFNGLFVSDTNIEIGADERLLLEAYVPGIELVKDAQRYDMIIAHHESDEERLRVQGSNLVVQGRWDGKLPLDLYHLLYGVARQHYLKHNLFPAHAACVGEKNLTLLVGHSGCGKSAVVGRLADWGVRMFSGNKTVVSFGKNKSLRAVAGTKTMTQRTEDLGLLVHEILRYGGVSYGSRIAYRLSEEMYAPAGMISSIVILGMGDARYWYERLEPRSALHSLYPYFLDTVNADVLIGNDIFHGEASRKAKEHLARGLAGMVDRVPVFSAVGSISFLTQIVYDLQK